MRQRADGFASPPDERVEHRTSADPETHVLVFEPIGTGNTGNVADPTFTTVDVPI